MSKFLLAFIFLSALPLTIGAQSSVIFEQAKKNEIEVFESDLLVDRDKLERTVLLPMPYASPELIDAFIVNELKSGRIKAINLYYTDYPKGRNLDRLNQTRIVNLVDAYDVVLDTSIIWTINRQMSCRNKEEADQMFHGFEIILDIAESKDLAYLHLQKETKDPVVAEVFKRNSWDSMLVVADFTGSMSSYISQLLLWVKLNNSGDRTRQFVFFNDGNGRTLKYKLLGKTGGIYPVRSKIYREIEFTAKKCRKAGNGGDIPENDIEALLAGLRLCPDCKEVVLIADNNSDVRDIMLSVKLDRPIRILLCGVDSVINPIYLNLARRTGGSIHLIEEDLVDLAAINEGAILEVNDYKYLVKDQAFVLLNE